jgi:hypothetical protein
VGVDGVGHRLKIAASWDDHCVNRDVLHDFDHLLVLLPLWSAEMWGEVHKVRDPLGVVPMERRLHRRWSITDDVVSAENSTSARAQTMHI